MKVLHHGVWLLLALLLQSVTINYISFFGAHAELFLVVVVVIALYGGKIQGMVCGMVYGLALDLLVGRIIGADVISFAAVGYIMGFVSEKHYTPPPFYMFMLLTAASTAAAEVIYMIPYVAVLGGNLPLLTAVRTILIESALNAVLVLPVMWCMKRTLSLCKIKNTIFR